MFQLLRTASRVNNQGAAKRGADERRRGTRCGVADGKREVAVHQRAFRVQNLEVQACI